MIEILLNQQYLLFAIIAFALIFSLTFHEFGHGFVAFLNGDNTAKNAGRLTLNPIPHIDPVGLLMVLLIGIGYARPVPTDPRNYRNRWGILLVAAAGPAMNLLLAVITINLYIFGLKSGWELFSGQAAYFFFTYLASINMLLMLFNLIPIGPLDGHYILPYALSDKWAMRYLELNHRYGTYALLALVGLHFIGVPVFQTIMSIGNSALSMVSFM